MTRDRDPSGGRSVPPGVALMPEDFPRRLAALKKLTGLTWEGMADALGVDPRQLLRWRKRDGEPNGGAMLSLARLAARVPGGLDLLLYGDYDAIRIPRRSLNEIGRGQSSGGLPPHALARGFRPAA